MSKQDAAARERPLASFGEFVRYQRLYLGMDIPDAAELLAEQGLVLTPDEWDLLEAGKLTPRPLASAVGKLAVLLGLDDEGRQTMESCIAADLTRREDGTSAFTVMFQQEPDPRYIRGEDMPLPAAPDVPAAE